MAKKGHMYRAVGHGEKMGKKIRYLAKESCRKCFGKGTTAKNLTTGKMLGCSCLKTTDLPIMWVVL